MALDEPCKYLGIEEGDSIDNIQMKDKLVKEYYRFIWQFLKTVKLEEQNQSYQHASCTISSLQLCNSQLIKKSS